MDHLFKTKSPLFILVSLVTFGLLTYDLYLTWSTTPSAALHITKTVIFAFALIILFFALFPWYGIKFFGLGISEHFRNILIPCVYVLLIYVILARNGYQSLPANFVLGALLFVVMGINGILLFYHFKDKDSSPPAYFAANLYLKEEGKSNSQS